LVDVFPVHQSLKPVSSTPLSFAPFILSPERKEHSHVA
jgi:hypothetical protein